ncbi:MAG TPA: hypothetical protein DCK93_15075, partial [Blastocatellia bacterium]|nr:hypothetical protein [Blastocatellia bacterium]
VNRRDRNKVARGGSAALRAERLCLSVEPTNKKAAPGKPEVQPPGTKLITAVRRSLTARMAAKPQDPSYCCILTFDSRRL